VSDLGAFKFVTAAHGNSKNGLNKVVMTAALLNVNATNVQIDSATLRFYNKADNNVKGKCTAITTAGAPLTGLITDSFIASCKNGDATVNLTIDQNSSLTYVLQANVTNAKINSAATSTLQVSLQNFTDITQVTLGATTSHFKWFDQDTVQNAYFWVEFPDTVVKSTSYQS
jgi:hypothetical protein